MATNTEKKEEAKQVLISLSEFLNNSNLSDVDKFVFNQNLIGESDKTLAEWEKIKMNIFS